MLHNNAAVRSIVVIVRVIASKYWAALMAAHDPAMDLVLDRDGDPWLETSRFVGYEMSFTWQESIPDHSLGYGHGNGTGHGHGNSHGNGNGNGICFGSGNGNSINWRTT